MGNDEGKRILDYGQQDPLIPPDTVFWVRRMYDVMIAVAFVVAVAVALLACSLGIAMVLSPK